MGTMTISNNQNSKLTFNTLHAEESPSGGSHSGYGLRFTVSEPLTIIKATVRPYDTGTRNVVLHNWDTEELIIQKSIDFMDGFEQKINLGFYVEPGITYWMGLSPTINLMRTDSKTMGYTRGHFTFPSGGRLSDKATASRYYYFFDIKYRLGKGGGIIKI